MATTRPSLDDPLNAFCRDTDAYLEGAEAGPLAGTTFAAKDIFDVAGHVCGAGNPDWKRTHSPAAETAWAVSVLVDAGATLVGKTHTDELTRGIYGTNAHYGTPINPRAPGRVPGGSSSGSAAAVAGGLVDFALGSDTGGSVRIPASFCGLYGIRPTHGRISMQGVMMGSPSYDTVGFFADDAELFARVGQVLLQTEIPALRPAQLVVVDDAFALAEHGVDAALRPQVERVGSLVHKVRSVRLAEDGLEAWTEQQVVQSGRETLAAARDWIDEVNPRFSFEVAMRYATAEAFTEADEEAARGERERIRTRVGQLLSAGTVLCLPTATSPAPPVERTVQQRLDLRQRTLALTCIAGSTGCPQVSLPLAEVDGLPVGLSLLAARGGDEMLIGFAREIAAVL